MVQVDDAFIPYNHDRFLVDGKSLSDYLKQCELRIEALNHALRDVPDLLGQLAWPAFHPYALELLEASVSVVRNESTRSSAILLADMAVQVGERLLAFLNEKMPAILSTTRRDGSVQSVPLWYEYADGSILINGGPTRDWWRHMRRDGRATLLFVDPQNMFRWAQIQGRLVSVTEDPGGAHINHLSHRYFERDYPGPRTDRVKIQIEPVRVTGGENRQPWDVT